jgi:hypothetical protein
MSTVEEFQAAIPKLSREEIEQIRTWINDYLEDQLELTDDVKARLDQWRREIAAGQYTTRQPKQIVAAALQIWSPRSRGRGGLTVGKFSHTSDCKAAPNSSCE